MSHVPGTFSAHALLQVGVPRADGVRALCRNIGLTVDEAEQAWIHALTTNSPASSYGKSAPTRDFASLLR